MSWVRRLVMGLVGTAALGCDASQDAGRLVPTVPQREEVFVEAAAPSLWASEIVDTTGPGAMYAMFVPPNWDATGRRLVIFIHGYVTPWFPVSLPNINRVRDALGARGWAVIYSSFSENGSAAKDGAERTHQLRGLFTARFGEPARTYLYGRSFGGLIGLMLAEKYQEHYSGLFAECGAVGGTRSGFGYKIDVRRLFDYFYPGVLPGNALGVPEDWHINHPDTVRVKAAMRADMTGALAIAQIDQTPVPYASLAELRESITEALIAHSLAINDLMQRTHGRSPWSSSIFTATNADGSSRLDDALLESLNQNTLRFESSPDAVNFLEREYEPSGDLRIPVTVFITSRDPNLPSPVNELVYQRRVDAAGRSDMLRLLHEPDGKPRYGHCAFTSDERVNALLEFATWADSKEVRP